MKKLTTILALLASFAFAAVVGAQRPSTYSTGIQVQNLSSSDTATISMSFYALDNGTASVTASDTIPAGESKTYFPLDSGTVTLPAGFDGAAVISSDQPVAAIVNVLGDGFAAGSSYGSFSEGSATVSLPLIAKNQVGIYDTFVNVQNAGSSDTTVTISYANTTCTDTATIPAGAATRFDQSADTCLPDGYVGAATVTTGNASDSIVATVIETSNNNTGLFAYNGFTSGSTDIAAPLVMWNNSGFQSGFAVQNAGTASTDVTIEYTPVSGQGTACTETATIAAGASVAFGLYAHAEIGNPVGTDTCANALFVGSARVSANSANQPLVGIVNQTNFTNFASAYNAFDPSQATNSLSMPLLMDRNGGFYTGFNLQNAGTASANVTCTFSTSAGGQTISQFTATLAAGAPVNQLQLDAASASAYVGSATCTADQPIIAVVNQLGSSSTADLLFTYEAFNQ
ncbi:MAG: hypothetical protein AAF902_10590 [Chloroflexota bacterium]